MEQVVSSDEVTCVTDPPPPPSSTPHSSLCTLHPSHLTLTMHPPTSVQVYKHHQSGDHSAVVDRLRPILEQESGTNTEVRVHTM